MKFIIDSIKAAIESAENGGMFKEAEDYLRLDEEIRNQVMDFYLPKVISERYLNIHAISDMEHWKAFLEGFKGLTDTERYEALTYMNCVLDFEHLRQKILASKLGLKFIIKLFPDQTIDVTYIDVYDGAVKLKRISGMHVNEMQMNLFKFFNNYHE